MLEWQGASQSTWDLSSTPSPARKRNKKVFVEFKVTLPLELGASHKGTRYIIIYTLSVYLKYNII